MEKVITKVKSPIDRDNRLTKNKVYKARQCGKAVELYGRSFYITCDNGSELFCNENICAHLQSRNWIVVEEV